MKMQIPKLRLNFDPFKQYVKISEELNEVGEELVKVPIQEEKIIEECYDVILATFNLLFMFEDDKEELEYFWNKVKDKIEDREARGYVKIEKYINL